MDKARTGINSSDLIKLFVILYCSLLVNSCEIDKSKNRVIALDEELKNYVDKVFSVRELNIVPGVKIEEINDVPENNRTFTTSCDTGRSLESLEAYVHRKIEQFSTNHLLSVNLSETARFFSAGILSAENSAKNSLLTSFGVGFFVFALKKLLLPFFIGAQLIKSVIIAMLLPSILGGLGKIVGKGLSTFSGISGASSGLNQQPQNQLEDFEFKDMDPYENDINAGQSYNIKAAATNNQLAELESTTNGNGIRIGTSANQRFSFATPLNDNYYLRRPNRKTDYKVFHKIPSSSLLLTSYDPFYSPLLSRLDAIFQQLGFGNSKSSNTELCRERLICLMYANPAKYAPYSNLVSAQLSRELNELRKPSIDNPEILRFFRYMKAAKNGQDKEECESYRGCPSLASNKPSPAMITTYNDINKLVSARNLG
ncbi:uncharacterized protein LOC130891487 [Diorhabda carinulata]|uniref:uncharacterized protein LOC130891487 n=1 Tax=Diorhabda carinulata TaxID=1163345 RepID=UPI0025A2C242|nr:uncharacterized protein LOC130891487 [Diorhabda carinulata]